jgi:hypothetical protein
MVQADPVRVPVRFRLRTEADLDIGDDIRRSGYNGDRVAQVALKPDGFIVFVKVFATMTAETAR